MKRSDYAFPCCGCICNHCANSVETIDNCTGEAKEPCFVCDECRRYDGDTKNPDKWKQECDEYVITEEQAKRNRKKFKIVNVVVQKWKICDTNKERRKKKLHKRSKGCLQSK